MRLVARCFDLALYGHNVHVAQQDDMLRSATHAAQTRTALDSHEIPEHNLKWCGTVQRLPRDLPFAFVVVCRRA